ncbi:MAG: SDR family oxidoreductase [Thalassobaculum sp.]|uniref:SDR family NAD(P)-dependent oxidoreductase n=1 Tax=Thalassobaculum sp. TaxID=2022740 RepID=UPI0032F067A0
MTDQFSVAGMNAVVTGAAGDIGRCLVAGLLEGGATVVAVDRDTAGRDAAKAAWASGRVTTAACDITDEAAVDRLFAEAVPANLDLLVNNAGVLMRAAPEDTEFARWRALMSVNVDAAFLCARAAGRLMRPRGSGAIVNISSIASIKALDGRVAYCTSKAAIAHMTRSLALEWGPHGIRSNAIAPGFIRTRMNADLRAIPEKAAAMTAQVPLKRFAEPEELVGPLLFLASPAARYVNGHILFVDGGLQVT